MVFLYSSGSSCSKLVTFYKKVADYTVVNARDIRSYMPVLG